MTPFSLYIFVKTACRVWCGTDWYEQVTENTLQTAIHTIRAKPNCNIDAPINFLGYMVNLGFIH